MNILKQFSIYTISTLIVSAIPFFLLPVLTEYLTPEDYGTVSLINSVVRVLIPFIGIGIIYSNSINFFKLDSNEFKSFLSSSLLLPLSSFLIILFLFAVSSSFIVDKLGVGNLFWVLVIPALGFFAVSEELALAILRNQKKAYTFGTIKILKALIEISLTIFLVVVLQFDWEGRMYSWLSVSIIMALISFIFLKKSRFIDFSAIKKSNIKSALYFGLPLIPDQICTFTLHISDRFFISEMSGLEDLGIYSVGSQIGMIIIVITGALLKGFIPFQFENMVNMNRDKKIKIISASYLFMTIIIVSFVGLIFIAPYIFKLLNQEYFGGLTFVLWIALGYIFEAIYNLANQYLLFSNKTKIIAYISITTVVINITLNYLMIDIYGTIGAAYATLISYIFLASTTFIIAQNIFPMPWLAFREIYSLIVKK